MDIPPESNEEILHRPHLTCIHASYFWLKQYIQLSALFCEGAIHSVLKGTMANS